MISNRNSTMSYPVSCSGCYSSVLVVVTTGHRARRQDRGEERDQVELAGWSYLNGGYPICPGCAPAWAPALAA